MTLSLSDIPDDTWSREEILPEAELPDAAALMDEGRKRADTIRVGRSPFLQENGVESEIQFKEQCMLDGIVMLHAQIGYRDPEKTCRAYAEVYETVTRQGSRVDRYGICLDWAMGYPKDERHNTLPGTGLILEEPEEFQKLTAMAPVAPHFGDFVLGMPGAMENTESALLAGSTAIGNLGQYFTYRLPNWDDDVATTKATVQALALCAAQPVPVLIHSNLDDGFAALFTDLSCALGAVLLERYVVETLMGCRMGHCYGHTFSDPVSRWAFQRGLARLGGGPGTMIYGNTTSYGPNTTENYAALASYIGIDIMAQRRLPTGHAVNPVPVSEALRIPDIDEIIDANLFAKRLMDRTELATPLYDEEHADRITDHLVTGAKQFHHAVLTAFEGRGIDIKNPLEMLLAMKRMGARRLESLYGPGAIDAEAPTGRQATVETPVIKELNTQAQEILANSTSHADAIRRSAPRICIATTDVHEYGKVLLGKVLDDLGVAIIDAGVSIDAHILCQQAMESKADAIAISTYNGIALSFLSRLKDEMVANGVQIPIYIGGKLNQIPDDSNSSLPIEVSGDLAALGAIPCATIEDMIQNLATIECKLIKAL